MSRTYGRGHDMNIDGNERMNIRCELESCVILCEMHFLSIRDFLCFCSGASEEHFFFLCARVGHCISCVLASNPSQTTTFLVLTLILRRSRTGTVWFYTSTSNKRAARPKLYTKSLTRDLKLMYIRLTLVIISINL